MEVLDDVRVQFQRVVVDRIRYADHLGVEEEQEAIHVSLPLLFVKPSNVIILDEPTNFINLDTIETLESLVEAHEGTVTLTSHDKCFVERMVDIVYQIEGEILKL